MKTLAGTTMSVSLDMFMLGKRPIIGDTVDATASRYSELWKLEAARKFSWAVSLYYCSSMCLLRCFMRTECGDPFHLLMIEDELGATALLGVMKKLAYRHAGAEGYPAMPDSLEECL